MQKTLSKEVTSIPQKRVASPHIRTVTSTQSQNLHHIVQPAPQQQQYVIVQNPVIESLNNQISQQKQFIQMQAEQIVQQNAIYSQKFIELETNLRRHKQVSFLNQDYEQYCLESENQLQQANDQIAKLEEQCGDLTKQRDEKIGEVENLLKEKAELEQQVSGLQEQVKEKNNKMQEQDEDLKTLQVSLEETQKQLNEYQEGLQDANRLLGKTKTKNSYLKTNYQDLQTQLKACEEEIEKLKGQVSDKTQENITQSTSLKLIAEENESLKKALQENLTESEQYNLIMTQEIDKLNEDLKNKNTELTKSYSNVQRLNQVVTRQEEQFDSYKKRNMFYPVVKRSMQKSKQQKGSWVP